MKNRGTILITFLLLTVLVNAQKDSCLNDVKHVYEAWTKAVKASSENTIYLKYETEVVAGNKSGGKKTKSAIELISKKENSYLKALNTEVFQDEETTVSILSDKKVIVINGVVGEEYKKIKMGQFEIFKDSVFTYLQTKECEIVTINNKVYKRVLLETNNYGAKSTKMATIEFLLDEEKNMVKEIKVKYVPGHRFQSMKMNILKQNLNYQTNKFQTKAVSKVLNSKGKLHSKYEGYRLIDNRIKR
jgi:hypothetical protein